MNFKKLMLIKRIYITAAFALAFTLTGFGQSTRKEIKYLSGTDNTNTAAWDFYCTGGRNSGYWTKIAVPSCWEQQGFGSYNFGRDFFTYGKKFKYADEQGKYKHEFTIPASWKDKDIYIVFEGSMTDTEVLINGQPAGEKHQGAFYRFKYNITNKVKSDKINKLEVNVSKMSSNESVNNAERLADYWIFGGIFRPVYLEAYPKEFIERTAIVAKADGSFVVDVYIKNLKSKYDLYADILDAKGKVVGTAKGSAQPNDTLVTLKSKVANPLLWTSETPALYKVNLSLKAGQKEMYQTSEKFGFRTIDVKPGDGVYLNGKKIKLKGINRHCFWPETGRTLNSSIDLMDLMLIKEMNMNAVRCSHYPPDQSFLNICDSLGLYVLDELAGWQKAYNTNVGSKLVREMVIRDVNHPSILFWDNGNEGGTNKELDDDFLMYDPSKRPVLHPHHRPGNAFSHVDTNHYEDFYSVEKILKDSLIYMPTEFLHCQDDGGGGAALKDFWELMWASPKSAGGFLWAFLDEGITRTDHNGLVDANGVNAPDGVVGPHREKEGSFYAIREILSPVVISLKDLSTSFNGDIEVENRFHFTNLNQCSFSAELINFRKNTDVLPGYISGQKIAIASPSVAPGEKGKLHINLPSNWQNYDALLFSAVDPFKNEIYKWSMKIKGNAALINNMISTNKSGSVEMTETDTAVTLKANSISVTFSKKTGVIQGLKNDDSEYKLSFANGPVLVSGYASLSEFKHFKETDGYVIEVKYTGDMKYARWKMQNNGWLSLDYEYSLTGKYNFTGISFDYPEGLVIGAKWLGKGPYRVWKNRLDGVTDNVWESLYNITQTGISPWFYPEFKGYYSDISWLELNTAEGKFVVATKDKGLFVRLFEFYGFTGTQQPDLPIGNISFLDNIPPIGTKMATKINSRSTTLGPSSNLNEVSGPIKRTLYFYFGHPE